MHHNDTKEERNVLFLLFVHSLYLNLKWIFFMSVKTKSQNECFFLCISTSPLPHKEKTKMVGVLMW